MSSKTSKATPSNPLSDKSPGDVENAVRGLLAQDKGYQAVRWLKDLGWKADAATEYVLSVLRHWEREHCQQESRSLIPSADTIARAYGDHSTPAEMIALLQYGLYLEVRKMLLPWNTPLIKLEQLGPPQTRKASDWLKEWYNEFLEWPDEAVLRGLSVCVSVCSLLSFRGLASIQCQLADSAFDGDPWVGIELELSHLAHVLGPPTRKRSWGGYVWTIGKVEVNLGFRSCNEMYQVEDFYKYVEVSLVDPGVSMADPSRPPT